MTDYSYLVYILVIIYLTFSTLNESTRFKLACIITFIFIGLRACVVGADTYYYTLCFMGYNFYNGADIEPIFKSVYVPLLSGILKYEPFYICVNTFISLLPLFFIIKKYSDNKVLSILCFFLFGYYVSYFVALRQVLGLAFLLWGIFYVDQNRKHKWIVYSILTLIAVGFHRVSIFCALFFIVAFFLRLESRKTVISLILGTAIFGIILNSFDILQTLKFFLNFSSVFSSDRLNAYADSNHLYDMGSTGFIFKLRYAWFGIYCFLFMDKEKINHTFSKLFLLSICIFNMFQGIDMISRINLSFEIFSIVVFTWAFKNCSFFVYKQSKIKFLYTLFVFAWFIQFYAKQHIDYDLSNVDRMHPYYFFWEDYSNHPSITRF